MRHLGGQPHHFILEVLRHCSLPHLRDPCGQHDSSSTTALMGSQLLAGSESGGMRHTARGTSCRITRGARRNDPRDGKWGTSASDRAVLARISCRCRAATRSKLLPVGVPTCSGDPISKEPDIDRAEPAVEPQLRPMTVPTAILSIRTSIRSEFPDPFSRIVAGVQTRKPHNLSNPGLLQKCPETNLKDLRKRFSNQ